jgi:hypothetical protein
MAFNCAMAIGGLTAQGQGLGCIGNSSAIVFQSWQTSSVAIVIRNILPVIKTNPSASNDRRAKGRGRRKRIARPNTEPCHWFIRAYTRRSPSATPTERGATHLVACQVGARATPTIGRRDLDGFTFSHQGFNFGVGIAF